MWQLLTMPKKIIILVFIILILIAGGGFFWWDGNQKDVRGLNKNLPEGVRVVKSLFGKEYKVVNKIDGYEFKVPEEWGGIEDVDYIPEREVKGFQSANITIEGLKGEARLMGISSFKEKEDLNLKDWAQKMFNAFGLVGDFTPETVGDFETIKTQENIHLGGMYVYFLKKNLRIYVITGGSEEFIRYIIANGKW